MMRWVRLRPVVCAIGTFVVHLAAGPLAEQQTVTISGRVLDPFGQPVQEVEISAGPDAYGPATAAVFAAADGSFALEVPSGLYILTVGSRIPPYTFSFQRVDASHGNVTDLALRIGAQNKFVPDDPPRASLIGVSRPDSAGDVTVTGARGSVHADSFLILVTIDTGHAVKTRAAADGSMNLFRSSRSMLVALTGYSAPALPSKVEMVTAPSGASFLVSGRDTSGAMKHFARQIVLQGEELQMPEQEQRPKRRAVR